MNTPFGGVEHGLVHPAPQLLMRRSSVWLTEPGFEVPTAHQQASPLGEVQDELVARWALVVHTGVDVHRLPAG
jgi:hypothetical protein